MYLSAIIFLQQGETENMGPASWSPYKMGTEFDRYEYGVITYNCYNPLQNDRNKNGLTMLTGGYFTLLIGVTTN